LTIFQSNKKQDLKKKKKKKQEFNSVFWLDMNFLAAKNNCARLLENKVSRVWEVDDTDKIEVIDWNLS
jgi:hypothetical protein